ncbi:MAG: DUF3386 family protein [Planctomycetes bacterium]|nr:DUF3386 family protein [Planctomycetota bacterium]
MTKPTTIHRPLRAMAVNAGLVLFATMILPVADGADKRRGKSNAGLSAEQMMIRAHQSRAEWQHFPGFSADIIVTRDGHRAAGTLTVTADGGIKLKLTDKHEAQWAERSLKSVVAHRRSSRGRKYNVTFADNVKNHPLGRLIKLNEDLMGSVYRIKGDVITEVHRKMGTIRFTISITEVTRNTEGKYLPRSYSFSTWDAKTGDLKSNTTVHDSWKRVGKFDLPSRLLWVTTKNNGAREVRQIELRRHRLLVAKTAAK